MSEKNPSSRSIEAQNKAHLDAIEDAQVTLQDAVTASKRFFEANNADLQELAQQEDQERFPQMLEVPPEIAEPEIGGPLKASTPEPQNNEEVFGGSLPYPDVAAAHEAKVAALKQLHNGLRTAHRDIFGEMGEGEFGSYEIDYMNSDEIAEAYEVLDKRRKQATHDIEQAEQDLKEFYESHSDEVQANAPVYMQNDREERRNRAAQRAAEEHESVSSYGSEEEQ